MAEIDDKVLANFNKELEKMDKLLNDATKSVERLGTQLRGNFESGAGDALKQFSKKFADFKAGLSDVKLNFILDTSQIDKSGKDIKKEIEKTQRQLDRGGTGRGKNFTNFSEEQKQELRDRIKELQEQYKVLSMSTSEKEEYLMKVTDKVAKNRQKNAEEYISLQKKINALSEERIRIENDLAVLEKKGMSNSATADALRAAKTYNEKLSETFKKEKDNLSNNISGLNADKILAEEERSNAKQESLRKESAERLAKIDQEAYDNELKEYVNMLNQKNKALEDYEIAKQKIEEKERAGNIVTSEEKSYTSNAESTKINLEEKLKAKREEIEKKNAINLEGNEAVQIEQDRHNKRIEQLGREHASRLQTIDKKRYNELKKLQKDYEAKIKKIQAHIEKGSKSGVLSEKKIKDETELLDELKEKLKGINAEMGKINKSNFMSAADEDRLKTSDKFEEFEEGIEGVDGGMEKLRAGAMKLAGAFGLAFSVQGIKNFAQKSIRVRGEFELQQVALRSILQNKEKADEIWDKTMASALRSPFTAMQLATYTKQLSAYRIETDKLYESTSRLADISAGLGVEMDRLILAYGQVKAANFLRASEVRQFTEAGINIYGELATYFTELKNNLDELPNNKFKAYLQGMNKEVVETADVIDMVTKRLVKFEDVEEIFKRLTDEGGIFYNMQLIQSQTIKGQINKLRDAYDQMLNTIGKETQGGLNWIVAALNSIVQNWRAWAVVVKSFSIALLVVELTKLSSALFGFSKAGVTAGKATTKLAVTLNKLKASLKGNWLSMSIGAIFGLGEAALALNNRMKRVNKEIDAQSLSLYKTRTQLKEYNESIEKNNEVIANSASGEEDVAKARAENSRVMAKLNQDYPTLSKNAEIQKNGIVKLTGALKQYNEQLQTQILLQQASKQSSWFSDSLQENAKEFNQAAQVALAELIGQQERARAEMLKLELSGKSVVGNKRYETLKKITEIDTSNLNAAITSYEELNKELDSYGKKLKNISISFHDKASLKDSINDMADVLNGQFLSAIRAVPEYTKILAEQYGNDTSKFLKDYSEQINKDLESGVYGDFLMGFRNFFENQLGVTTKDLQAVYNSEIRDITKGVDIFKKHIEDITGNGPEQPDKGAQQLKSIGALISLLKEMNSDYEKLSKSAYGYSKSLEIVNESYEASFREIFKAKSGDMMLDWKAINVSNKEGVVKAMEDLKKYMDEHDLWGGYAENARKELEKAISQMKVEQEIDVRVKLRENFKSDLDKIFANMDLANELKNLNISDEVAEQMFGLDVSKAKIEEVRNRISEYVNARKEGSPIIGLSSDDLRLIQEYSKKIADIELKNQKERAKEYTKYLEQELSERAKLQMEYAGKVAKVSSETAFNEEQKNNIKARIDKEFADALQELNWKSFKESDFYVEMMEDITSMPAEYADIMLTKLNEIIADADNLSPRALKEAINARVKVLEAQIDLQPLKTMTSLLKNLKEEYKDMNFSAVTPRGLLDEVEDRILANTKQIEEYDKEIKQYEQVAAEAKAYEDALNSLNLAKKSLIESDEQVLDDEEKYEAELASLQARLEKIKQELIDQKGYNALSETSLADDDVTRQKRSEIEILQTQIDLLIEARKRQQEFNAVRAQIDPKTLASMESDSPTSSTQQTKLANEIQAEKEKIEKQNARLKNDKKLIAEIAEAWHKFNKNLNETISKVNEVGQSFADMFEALGGETNALTEGWKEFGSSMTEVVTGLLTALPSLITMIDSAGQAINKAFGVIGLVATIIQLIIQGVTAVAKLRDSKYKKQIEDATKKIDELQKAYDRLNKSIEKTVSLSGYMDKYNKSLSNLNRQLAEIDSQIAAENAKMKTSAEQLKKYKDDAESVKKQIEEVRQAQIETFGGINDINYRSTAEGFVDAWKSAFLETGSGLSGLEDHFNEFLQSWFTKQATMRVAGNMLENVFREIDTAVSKGSDGGFAVTTAELTKVRTMFDQIAPELSNALEQLAGAFDLSDTGSLSGLAAGISGMTEQQANVLEAYWNSVRMYTASLDQNVAAIAASLGVGSNSPNTNPMLQQLNLIAQQTSRISTLLSSVSTSGGQGYGLKVYSM